MNRAAEARVMPIRAPDGRVQGFTVRGHRNLPTGWFPNAERAYEEALQIELNRRAGVDKSDPLRTLYLT